MAGIPHNNQIAPNRVRGGSQPLLTRLVLALWFSLVSVAFFHDLTFLFITGLQAIYLFGVSPGNCIDNQRNGSVVDKLHVHVGLENSGFDFLNFFLYPLHK